MQIEVVPGRVRFQGLPSLAGNAIEKRRIRSGPEAYTDQDLYSVSLFLETRI